ncbi:hypothetical protein C8J57DRAFT_1499428 [Mycena rebaudengoi]|nr:hypothetical protein C8J57DRAFT_1499428 [Mycena rebaudengoi]
MEIGGVALPLDLERAVFEAAAILDRKNIPRLLLVAQRVHEWLKPLLYRVLVYSEAPHHGMPPIHDGLIPALFQQHVRHLLLLWKPTSTDLNKLLTGYTGVRDFACHFQLDPSLIPYLDRVRPLRLRMHICGLFPGAPDFSLPMFVNVTHFDIPDRYVSHFNDESWKSLSALPCLTHIAFNGFIEIVPIDFLHMFLSRAKLLQALLLVNTGGLEGDHPLSYPTHDPRFVTTVGRYYTGDWIRIAWGEERVDMWAQVDNFIRLKRRGDVSKDCFFLEERDWSDDDL